jgi:hypothetical protein
MFFKHICLKDFKKNREEYFLKKIWLGVWMFSFYVLESVCMRVLFMILETRLEIQ